MPKKFAALAVLLLCLPLSGCYKERICMEGEYPVLYQDTGTPARCVKNGETPPPGTTPYPPGQTPTWVSEQ